MLHRPILAVALALGLSSQVQAQSLVGGKVVTSTPSFSVDQNIPLQMNADGTLKVALPPGSGATANPYPGSDYATAPNQTAVQSAPGTSATKAGGVQGVTGGLPVGISGTIAATQSGTWTFGLSGPIPSGSNVIGAVTQSGGPWTVSGTVAATQSSTWTVGLASGSSVLADLRVGGALNTSGNPIFAQITNFPASQPVTNAGTFAVQNTAAVVGGNTTAVKTDGSATTQPVSAAALPLPAGAATDATLQTGNASTAALNTATGAQSDAASASGANTSVIGALRAIRDRLLGTLSTNIASALPPGGNIIGKTGIDQTTPGTTNGVVVNPVTNSFISYQFTITTTANNFTSNGTTNQRTLKNIDTTNTIYLGTAGVTATTGFPLKPGESITFDAKNTTAQFYALSGAGSPILAVIGF